MRKLLTTLLLLAWPALAQPVGIINNGTPISGGTTGQCVTKGSNGLVSMGACSAGSVTTFSAGTTGLTPSTGTAGSVTLAGTLIGANGGTGVANTGKTITLGGNLTTTGAFNSTFAASGSFTYTLPGATSTLAILNANTFTAAQTLPAGTSVLPSLAIGQADLGLHRQSTNVMGITVKGLTHTAYQISDVAPNTNNQALTRLGRSQTVNTGGAWHYPVTFFTETQTLTGNSAVVPLNVGPNTVLWGDTGTKTIRSYNYEADKLEFKNSAGGTVTMTGGVGSVFIRTPFPTSHASGGVVNMDYTFGITFSRINASEVTGGTIDRTIMMELTDQSGGANLQPTNGWHGIIGAAGYTSHIGSYDGIPLLITANSIGSSAGILNLNAKNAGAVVNLQYNGTTAIQIAQTNGSGLQFSANNTPLWLVTGSGSNIGIGYATKGVANHDFYTHASSSRQLSIEAVASAVNYARIGGGSLGNPAYVGVLGSDSIIDLLLIPKGATGKVITNGAGLGFQGMSYMNSVTDGYLSLYNAAGNNFTGLRFGGVTSSFPMWKRSTTSLIARLADDSANTTIEASSGTLTALISDAATTNNTVCVTTTTGVLTKGSGTLGICLGTSSVRYKHDLAALKGDALSNVVALRPLSYRYNKGYGDDGAKDMYGFTAEDVVGILPDLVGLDNEGRPNTVDMVGMIPVLTKAIQQLKADNDNLALEVRALKVGTK